MFCMKFRILETHKTKLFVSLARINGSRGIRISCDAQHRNNGILVGMDVAYLM